MNQKIIQNYSKVAAVASLLLILSALLEAEYRYEILYIGFGLLWTIYFALDLKRGSSHHTFSTFSLCVAVFAIFSGLLPLCLSLLFGNPLRWFGFGEILNYRIASRLIYLEAVSLILTAFAVAVKFLKPRKLRVTVLLIWVGLILVGILEDLWGGRRSLLWVRGRFPFIMMIVNAFWIFMVAYGGKYLKTGRNEPDIV